MDLIYIRKKRTKSINIRKGESHSRHECDFRRAFREEKWIRRGRSNSVLIKMKESFFFPSPVRARASRYRESAYPLSGSLGTFLKCLRCQSSRRKLGEDDARFGDVHSPEKVFANSFRLDFPPSSRIRFVEGASGARNIAGMSLRGTIFSFRFLATVIPSVVS